MTLFLLLELRMVDVDDDEPTEISSNAEASLKHKTLQLPTECSSDKLSTLPKSVTFLTLGETNWMVLFLLLAPSLLLLILHLAKASDAQWEFAGGDELKFVGVPMFPV